MKDSNNILMITQNPTKILVTVGTTQFDSLIVYTDSEEFINIITQAGYVQSDILYQFGTTGQYVPSHKNQFRLNNDINKIFDSHQVIITHGGAGTLLACLHDSNPNKKIIAVANTTLSGNHQTELINKLHEQQYILGFDSLQSFKRGEKEVVSLLKGQRKLKKYQKVQRSVLNSLIFGQEL